MCFGPTHILLIYVKISPDGQTYLTSDNSELMILAFFVRQMKEDENLSVFIRM